MGGLYLVTVALILAFRVGEPIRRSTRHRLRVSNVVTEAPGVISIYMSGRDLDQLAVRSGQYFVWRFLTRDGWWRGHPFSISSAPNGSWLRITIKELGDWSKALQGVSVGTRVFIEGPYGVLTGARRTRPEGAPHRRRHRDHAASGTARGVARQARRHDPRLPRSRRRRGRLPGRARTLARSRGAQVHYLVGPARRTGRRLLDAASLERLVPDVRDRDVYLCGPAPMMQRVEESLERLGLPSSQIHAERFAY